jgi:hypothetical protein
LTGIELSSVLAGLGFVLVEADYNVFEAVEILISFLAVIDDRLPADLTDTTG